MKGVTIIISVLVLQTSASFFEDFRGAFVSVENNFGRLLNDVVSDVRVTIDCTVMAVEQALSLGGMFHDPSDYDKKCKTEKEEAIALTNVRDTSYIHEIAKQEAVATKDISREIEESILNVNRTLKNFLDKRDAYHEMESVRNVLKNETDRLTEVSTLLSRELDKISANVKREFKKLEFDPSRPTVDDVMEEAKILHELEQMEEDTSEAKEIRHVFDEVLSVLHSNDTVTLSKDVEFKEILTDLEKTSNNTFTDIENQFSHWKEGEKKHLDDIKTVVEKQNPENEKGIDIVEGLTKTLDVLAPERADDFPTDFKGVFNKILSDSTTSNTNAKASQETHNSTQTGVESNNKTTINETTTQEVQSSDIGDTDLSLINSYFLPKDKESRDEAVVDAADLIKQSKFTQMLMASLFNNADQESPVSVFDDPELLNFK